MRRTRAGRRGEREAAGGAAGSGQQQGGRANIASVGAGRASDATGLVTRVDCPNKIGFEVRDRSHPNNCRHGVWWLPLSRTRLWTGSVVSDSARKATWRKGLQRMSHARMSHTRTCSEAGCAEDGGDRNLTEHALFEHRLHDRLKHPFERPPKRFVLDAELGHGLHRLHACHAGHRPVGLGLVGRIEAQKRLELPKLRAQGKRTRLATVLPSPATTQIEIGSAGRIGG